MYRLLPFIISIFLISCSADKAEQRQIARRLQAWDKIIYDNPNAVNDSLSLMSKDSLSKNNLAYYSLLWNIVKEKTGDFIRNDTSISSSVEWYRAHKNEWNLCRALIYKVQNEIRFSIPDSFVMDNLKEAERLYVKNKFSQPETEALIYRNFGKAIRNLILYEKFNQITKFNENKGKVEFHSQLFQDRATRINLCEKYLNKSIDIYKKLGDTLNVDLARLDFFDIYYPGRADKAYAVLSSFLERDNLRPEVRHSLYTKLATVYRMNNMWAKSIYYTKMLIDEDLQRFDLDNSKASFYRSISNSYQKLGKKDSAILYLKMGAEAAYDDGVESSSYYYSLGSLYKDINDLEDAFKYTNISYLELRANSNEKIIQGKKLLNKKNTKLYSALNIVIKEKQRIIYIFLTCLMIMSVLSIYFFVAYYKAKLRYQAGSEESRRKIVAISEDKSIIWLVNEILNATAGLMPEFIDSVSMDASRSRKVSKEIYDNLSKSVNSLRTKAKSGITNITKEENFIASFPEVTCLLDLSSYEKIILILINSGFSIKEIAEMLVSNQSSIRTIKSKIKEKLLAEKELPYNVFKVFPFLNKDLN